MKKKRRSILAALLSIAMIGLVYTALSIGTNSTAANFVSDHDAEQLVGGEVCMTLRDGKCSAYFATPDGSIYYQACPDANPTSTVATEWFCGNEEPAYDLYYQPCGGCIPFDEMHPDGSYFEFGLCVEFWTRPGCFEQFRDPIPATEYP